MQALAGALLVLHLISVWWRARSTLRIIGPMLSTAGVISLAVTLWLGAWPATIGLVLMIVGAVVTTLRRSDRMPQQTGLPGAA